MQRKREGRPPPTCTRDDCLLHPPRTSEHTACNIGSVAPPGNSLRARDTTASSVMGGGGGTGVKRGPVQETHGAVGGSSRCKVMRATNALYSFLSVVE